MSENANVPQQEGLSDNARMDGLNESAPRRGSARGFASMDRQKQREIASEGGRAAHRQGVAHEWSREEAREAGRKGGQSVSQNRSHMSEIGRRGGQRSGGRRRQQSEGGAPDQQ